MLGDPGVGTRACYVVGRFGVWIPAHDVGFLDTVFISFLTCILRYKATSCSSGHPPTHSHRRRTLAPLFVLSSSVSRGQYHTHSKIPLFQTTTTPPHTPTPLYHSTGLRTMSIVVAATPPTHLVEAGEQGPLCGDSQRGSESSR